MRYLIAAFANFIAGIIVITLLLSLLGHALFVALTLGFIWSLCLQFLAWGTAFVLWPVGGDLLCQWSRHRCGVNPISRVSRKTRAVQPSAFSRVLSSFQNSPHVSGLVSSTDVASITR